MQAFFYSSSINFRYSFRRINAASSTATTTTPPTIYFL